MIEDVPEEDILCIRSSQKKESDQFEAENEENFDLQRKHKYFIPLP